MWWMLMAASAPTYLQCSFPSEREPFMVEITADEANSKATIAIPTAGSIETFDALFTPSEMRVRTPHEQWTLDRVNLSVSRALDFGAQPNVNEGKCEVKPAPAKRAF